MKLDGLYYWTTL